MFAKKWLVALGTGAAVAAAMSCNDGDPRPPPCNGGSLQCRTVCNEWCDYYGCYPVCWDQCWDDCSGPPGGLGAPPLADGAAPPADDGGGGVTNADGGVLCSACSTNADCGSGALCILRGGDAGTGFCGLGCSSPADCPQGFTCTQIGSTRQCLPTSASCP